MFALTSLLLRAVVVPNRELAKLVKLWLAFSRHKSNTRTRTIQRRYGVSLAVNSKLSIITGITKWKMSHFYGCLHRVYQSQTPVHTTHTDGMLTAQQTSTRRKVAVWLFVVFSGHHAPRYTVIKGGFFVELRDCVIVLRPN